MTRRGFGRQAANLWIWCLLLCAVAGLGAALTGAALKFHKLAVGAYPPGSRVVVTTAEFNRYLDAEIPNLIGPGVRNARVETSDGGVVRGTADIDFLKVRQATGGEKPSWLLQALLSGERPVEITVRVTSGHGMARVDVVRVVVSGVVAEGRTLELLISNVLLPTFPDAKVGKEFALDYGIERLEIAPGACTVVRNSQPFRAAQPR
jgi:hypothetical protein